MASATSSGRPTLPAGVPPAAFAKKVFRTSAGRACHHAVSMTPGDTAFTLTGASSRASGATMAFNAPFTAAKPDVPGLPTRAEAAVTNVTEPRDLLALFS